MLDSHGVARNIVIQLFLVKLRLDVERGRQEVNSVCKRQQLFRLVTDKHVECPMSL